MYELRGASGLTTPGRPKRRADRRIGAGRIAEKTGLRKLVSWATTAGVRQRCEWKEAPCERDVYYKSRGLCSMHYSAARRRGILDQHYPKPELPAICQADGCDRPRMTKGYCHSHYIRLEYRGLRGPLGSRQHRLSHVDLDAETATCSACGEDTPVLVSRRRGTGERYARMCLSLYPAVQARARQWLAANTSHALTDEERAELLARQGGVCANPSCGTPDWGRSRWTRLATDHDHSSDEDNVRGLICRRCNAAIGMAPGDDLTGVLGLAVYLATYERPDLAEDLLSLLAAVIGREMPSVPLGEDDGAA